MKFISTIRPSSSQSSPLPLCSLPGLLLAAATLFPWAAHAQAPPAAAALAFSAQAVQVQGMTPGGTVIWLGVARTVDEYAPLLSSSQAAQAADAQGRSQLAVAPSVARESIWVAVDLATGRYALDSPGGLPARRLDLDPAALDLGAGSAGDHLLDKADSLHVLLVRPGVGAWTKFLGRGGADDESDPADSRLRLAVSHLEPLPAGGPAAPAQLQTGDLLFVVHPRLVEIAAGVVGGRP